jgi:hypothetical protein
MRSLWVLPPLPQQRLGTFEPFLRCILQPAFLALEELLVCGCLDEFDVFHQLFVRRSVRMQRLTACAANAGVIHLSSSSLQLDDRVCNLTTYRARLFGLSCSVTHRAL